MIHNSLWHPPPGYARPKRRRSKPPPVHYAPDLDCNTCPVRKKLCARRLCTMATVYANQDYVGQREHCFSYIEGCQPNQVPTEDNAFLLAADITLSSILKLYFRYHLKITQIADITYRSQPYISKIIKQAKAKKTKK